MPESTIIDQPDPLAAQEIWKTILQIFDVQRETQIGWVLSTVGALGGFACQQAVWKACIEPRNRNPGDFLVKVGTRSGETYYFGEAINQFLMTAFPPRKTFFGMVAGAIPNPTPENLPDLKEIVEHVAKSVGSKSFGFVRLPKERGAFAVPRVALSKHWRWVEEALKSAGNPANEWPIILGLVAHRAVKGAQIVMEGSLAARLVMEAAIFMSKIDPATVAGATSGLLPPAQWNDRALRPERNQEVLTDVLPLVPTAMPKQGPTGSIHVSPQSLN